MWPADCSYSVGAIQRTQFANKLLKWNVCEHAFGESSETYAIWLVKVVAQNVSRWSVTLKTA